jgi:glutathione S-transferase
MMTLYYQTHSPYARKVLVFAYEAGLISDLDVIHQETSPTMHNPLVFGANPLGKVPVLMTPDVGPLFDSDVICAYLDEMHDQPSLIPQRGSERWRGLRMQSVAQGLADAGIAVRWETERRPEQLRFPALRDGYTAKLLAAYDWLEREIEPEAPIDIGPIAIATALDWLEFRDLPSFRPAHPRLAAWFDAFSQRPSMRSTPLTGETVD